MCSGISKYKDGGLKTLLGRYCENGTSNLLLNSIIAGICRSYGLNNDSIAMSLEIIDSIDDGTESLMDRNILVWNLYRLTKEYMDEGNYDRALELCSRAEQNWTRDTILGDDIGAYHVSWIEQLWIRRMQIYMLKSEEDRFQAIADKVLCSRLSLFEKALITTGEGIMRDKCTFSCFEIMAYEYRKKDYDCACTMLRQAIIHKGGEMYLKRIKTSKGKKGYYEELLKVYYRIPDVSYDNIWYGYCRTCRYFNGIASCESRRVNTDRRKACSRYEFGN